MINNANNIYPDVIPPNTEGNTIGDGKLTAGYKTIQATVLASLITLNYSAETDPFIVGEIVNGNSIGVTGKVISDDNISALVIQVLTGDWTPETAATGVTSGSVATISSVVFPSFKVGFLKSNQEYVPDPNLPVSPTNLYSPVGYVDESTGVFSPYTMSIDPATDQQYAKSLNVETAGARWMFVFIYDYVSGFVQKVDLEIFSA